MIRQLAETVNEIRSEATAVPVHKEALEPTVPKTKYHLYRNVSIVT